MAPIPCKTCGVEIPSRAGRGRPRIRCERCAPSRPVRSVERPSSERECCQVCGGEFERRPGRQTCSQQCGQRLRRQRGGATRKGRTCEVCGMTYDATYASQRTCGRACGVLVHSRNIEAAERRMRRANRPSPESVCLWCGRRFSHRYDKVVLFCCLKCDEAWRRRLHAKRSLYSCRRCGRGHFLGPRRNCDSCKAAVRRARRTADKRRRRALRAGVTSEAYTLSEVAVRDRFRCGICHGRVAMKRAAPHPKSPSIDHVLPLSAGGDDTRANVRLAHFSCNVRKRADSVPGGEQLMLIG
jgi:hypothetical protein